MTLKRKGARRYRITAKKGITIRLYTKTKKNKIGDKLPPIAKIYTKSEIEELAKQMGLTVSNKVK